MNVKVGIPKKLALVEKLRSAPEGTVYCVLHIDNDDMVKIENLIFFPEDFSHKASYIDGAYDDNLVHLMSDKVKISDWEFVTEDEVAIAEEKE